MGQINSLFDYVETVSFFTSVFGLESSRQPMVILNNMSYVNSVLTVTLRKFRSIYIFLS